MNQAEYKNKTAYEKFMNLKLITRNRKSFENMQEEEQEEEEESV